MLQTGLDSENITNHLTALPGSTIRRPCPQPPLDWNALCWVNVGTMVTDVWSPAISPHPFPQPTSPQDPHHYTPITHHMAICFVVHYCKGIISYSNCLFHLTPPSREWDPFGKNPISCLSYLCDNQGDWTVLPYRLWTLMGYWWVLSLCEPWQAQPQDHPKGLIHGTSLPSAVTRTHFTSHSSQESNYT